MVIMMDYNSYDRNSHYYGKRGNTGGSDGYGGARPTTVNAGGKSLTFGEKYEQAIKSNPSLNTVPKSGISSSPKNNANTPTNGTAPKTNPTPVGTSPKPYTPPTKTQGGNNPKPYTAPTKPYTPKTNPYTPPTKNNVPKTNPKPNYTPQPKNNTRPSYTKPSPKQNYNPPKSNTKPSYSPPSRSG